ncbi:MAG: hypothetical protein WDO73_21930 [Ignavibacteriota bacterium]
MLRSFLFEVDPADPVTLIAVGVLFARRGAAGVLGANAARGKDRSN